MTTGQRARFFTKAAEQDPTLDAEFCTTGATAPLCNPAQAADLHPAPRERTRHVRAPLCRFLRPADREGGSILRAAAAFLRRAVAACPRRTPPAPRSRGASAAPRRRFAAPRSRAPPLAPARGGARTAAGRRQSRRALP